MNASQGVSRLVLDIRVRFQGVPQREIERRLMAEGWCVAAIREALTVAAGQAPRAIAPQREEDVPGLSARVSRTRLLLRTTDW